MRHHEYLVSLEVLRQFSKERNSPKETEVLLKVAECVTDYIRSSSANVAKETQEVVDET